MIGTCSRRVLHGEQMGLQSEDDDLISYLHTQKFHLLMDTVMLIHNPMHVWKVGDM